MRKMIVEIPVPRLGFIPTAHFPQYWSSRNHFRQEMHGRIASRRYTPSCLRSFVPKAQTPKRNPKTIYRHKKAIGNPQHKKKPSNKGGKERAIRCVNKKRFHEGSEDSWDDGENLNLQPPSPSETLVRAIEDERNRSQEDVYI